MHMWIQGHQSDLEHHPIDKYNRRINQQKTLPLLALHGIEGRNEIREKTQRDQQQDASGTVVAWFTKIDICKHNDPARVRVAFQRGITLPPGVNAEIAAIMSSTRALASPLVRLVRPVAGRWKTHSALQPLCIG